MHWDIRGCPANVHTICYKGIVRLIMEYAATVLDPRPPTRSGPQSREGSEEGWLPGAPCRTSALLQVPLTLGRGLTSDLSVTGRRTVSKAMVIHRVTDGLVDLRPLSDRAQVCVKSHDVS